MSPGHYFISQFAATCLTSVVVLINEVRVCVCVCVLRAVCVYVLFIYLLKCSDVAMENTT